MAPRSSTARFSILARFCGSSQASLLATSLVVDSRITSTTRSLFATSEDPVSVMSTMAPTPGRLAFTSVAPQEYSTLTPRTPRFSKNFAVVLTSSDAMSVPSRSFTSRTGESSGTAMTHRAGLAVALEYFSSATSTTSEPFSTIQSAPQMPASRTPSATYREISCERNSTRDRSSSSTVGK